MQIRSNYGAVDVFVPNPNLSVDVSVSPFELGVEEKQIVKIPVDTAYKLKSDGAEFVSDGIPFGIDEGVTKLYFTAAVKVQVMTL